MQKSTFRLAATLAAATLAVVACTTPELTEQPQPEPAASEPPITEPDQGAAAESAPPAETASLAASREKPLPPVKKGAIERIDCLSGTPDWHARMALEAWGGQILSFAYYSKWKPRTCSLEFKRSSSGARWGMTPDGTVRVDTPQGRFLIRTRADAYVFEFEHVQRRKFCGMGGEINGTMTIKRGPGKPQCSVVGVMDTNDKLLDSLYKSKK